MIRSLAEAREAVATEPERWRACLYEATGTPVTERADTTVYLYRLIKTADEKLRERIRELKASGYVQTFGTLGNGLVKLEHDGNAVWLATDKRRAA